MFYSPHLLQKRVITVVRDALGRAESSNETWEDICPCRCDDNTTQKFTSDNGDVYTPKYHIVCPKNAIKAGDYVRCMKDGVLRGEGEVYIVKSTNYYNYTEIWV